MIFRQLIAAVLMGVFSGIPVAAQESWAVKKGLYKTAKDEKKTDQKVEAPTPDPIPVPETVLVPPPPPPQPIVSIDPDTDPTRPCYPDCTSHEAPRVRSLRDAVPPPVRATQVDKGPLSPTLIWVGFWTALVGGALAVPQGDDYSVNGNPYCVQSSQYSIDVNSGRCMPLNRKVGLLILAAGGGAMAIGLIPVARGVSFVPTASVVDKSIGAVATVKWGK